MARHSQQHNCHLRGLQLFTRIPVATGFSTHACEPQDPPSSHTGLARVTASDTGTENLLIPETTWGVRATGLSKAGVEMTALKRSSA